MKSFFISRRPRRNRQSAAIRAMVQETTVSVNDLIFPMFIVEGSGIKSEVKSMPNIYRYSLDTLLEELQEVTDLGIRCIDLFPNYTEEKRINMPQKATEKVHFTWMR